MTAERVRFDDRVANPRGTRGRVDPTQEMEMADQSWNQVGSPGRAVGDPNRFDGEADPDAIRADIESTRSRMGETIEEIGERLNPRRVKAQLKHDVREATIGKAEHMARIATDRLDDGRRGMIESIRDNPIPAAMVGIGLGWLAMNSRREHAGHHFETGRSHRRTVTTDRFEEEGFDESGAWIGGAYSTAAMGDGDESLSRKASDFREEAMERGEELKSRAEDRVVEIAHEARDTVGDFTEKAREKIDTTRSRARVEASDIADDVRRVKHRVGDRFDESLRENPLAVGAAAVAAGIALGLSAPTTRKEDELLGGARDEIFDRAEEFAREAPEHARHVVDRVTHEIPSIVREAARDEGMA